MARRSSRSDNGRLGVELAERLLAASVPPDLRAWGALLAETVTMRVGNRAPVVGHKAAMEEVALLLAGIESMGDGFRFLRPATDRVTVLMELEARLAGGLERIPLAIVLRPLAVKGGIVDLRVYLDRIPPTTESPRRLSYL